MRPIPQRRHLLAILILAAVAAAYGAMACFDEHLSATQVQVVTAAMKQRTPNLFQNDLIFRASPYFGRPLWEVHQPTILGLLDLSLVPTDFHDPALPFRALTPLLTLIYLLGMYALLYRQCRSWSVSAFVSILSSAVVFTLGQGFWGVGSLASATPFAIYLCVLPFTMLAFLRYREEWRVLLVFAFVGLMGNIHLAMAANTTLVLAIGYLGCRRFAPAAWLNAFGGAVCAALAASPSILYYVGLRLGMDPLTAPIPWREIRSAFAAGDLAIFYPSLLKSILTWALLLAVLMVPAAVVLSRVERFRVRELRFWVWFGAGGLFVSLALHGLSQAAGMIFHREPPLIDFLQASALVMLPLYVLFAQAMTNLFRLVRTHRMPVRIACAALMAAWMAPSDNFRPARNAILDTATLFMDETDKPRSVQRHHEQHAQRAELAAIGRWARRESDAAAVFITEFEEFRLLGQRSILPGQDDIRYFYYLAPGAITDWTELVVRQDRLLSKSTRENLEQFVDKLSARAEFMDVPQWYVILDAGAAPEPSDRIDPVPAEGWGQSLKLYRIR
jgi:hypothetical protein